MATLTATNTGTGLTFTLAGGGGVWAVYVWKLAAPPPSNWTIVGNVDTVTPLTIPLPLGVFTAYAVQGGVTTAPVIALVAPTAQDSVAMRCRASVRAVIETVSPWAKQVAEQWNEHDTTNLLFPCVVLTVVGVTDTWADVVHARDDRGRPVRVLVCDRQDVRDHKKLPAYEWRREKIERAFVNQRLPGVPESHHCTIEPGPIIDPSLPIYQLVVSDFVIRCHTRENRGIGA